MLFGAGLRHNLGEAYPYLMATYEPGDRIFLFGFSRGAYTVRALAGMLELCGIFRPGSENLVPYAVSEYAKQGEKREEDWRLLRKYARMHGRPLALDGTELRDKDHAPVHFMGIWDTVKAAGHLWRQLRWPYTRELPHVGVVRHAVSLDEKRRPYMEYLVEDPDPAHCIPPSQDLQEVWFAGVHSDVGGVSEREPRLSDLPMKWMAEEAVQAGLLVRRRPYAAVQRVTEAEATGRIHQMNRLWALLGTRRRRPPEGAKIHASVRRRIELDQGYAARLPARPVFVDEEWATPKRTA